MKTIHNVVIDALLRHRKLSSMDSSIIVEEALRINSSSSSGLRRQQHQQHVANRGTTASIIKMLMRAIKPDSTFIAYLTVNKPKKLQKAHRYG